MTMPLVMAMLGHDAVDCQLIAIAIGKITQHETLQTSSAGVRRNCSYWPCAEPDALTSGNLGYDRQ